VECTTKHVNEGRKFYLGVWMLETFSSNSLLPYNGNTFPLGLASVALFTPFATDLQTCLVRFYIFKRGLTYMHSSFGFQNGFLASDFKPSYLNKTNKKEH
jgi:ABC-type uncharacterized transport system permease subunit